MAYAFSWEKYFFTLNMCACFRGELCESFNSTASSRALESSFEKQYGILLSSVPGVVMTPSPASEMLRLPGEASVMRNKSDMPGES